MSQLIRKMQGTIAYTSAGQTLPVKIQRGRFLSRIGVHMLCQLDRAAGAAGTCRDSAPAQLAAAIELIADGSHVIRRVPLWIQHRINQLDHGVRPAIQAANLKGFAALNDELCQLTAFFDFERPRNQRWNYPIETLLDTRGLTDLELRITFGAGADIMDVAFGAPAITIDSAEWRIVTMERDQVAKADGSLEYAGRVFSTVYESVKTVNITAAGPARIDLTTPAIYTDLVLFTESDGDLVNTILPYAAANANKIRLKDGTKTIMEVDAGALQREARTDFQIEVPELVSSAAALDHGQQELVLPGIYPIHFSQDINLRESGDFRQSHELYMDLEVAHPGTTDRIYVYQRQLMVPEGAVLQAA